MAKRGNSGFGFGVVLGIVVAAVAAVGIVTWLDRQGPVQLAPSPPVPSPTIIRIDAKETIYLGNDLIEVGDISHMVSNLVRANPKTRVIVRSDPAVSYSLVMAVVDGLRAAGCSNILLETETKTP